MCVSTSKNTVRKFQISVVVVVVFFLHPIKLFNVPTGNCWLNSPHIRTACNLLECKKHLKVNSVTLKLRLYERIRSNDVVKLNRLVTIRIFLVFFQFVIKKLLRIVHRHLIEKKINDSNSFKIKKRIRNVLKLCLFAVSLW